MRGYSSCSGLHCITTRVGLLTELGRDHLGWTVGRDTMFGMSALTQMVAMEVAVHFVSPSWVAEHYGVSRQQVYRAIAAKRLEAVRVRGGTIVLDARLLPSKFPR